MDHWELILRNESNVLKRKEVIISKLGFELSILNSFINMNNIVTDV